MNNHLSRIIKLCSQKNIRSLKPFALSCVPIRENSQQPKDKKYKKYFGFGVGGAISFAFGISLLKNNKGVKEEDKSNFGGFMPNLPLYKMKDVSEHSTKKDRVWATYRQGVYDITDFIDQHPGGDIIMLAAGGSMDPFWNLYAVHKQQSILEILESFRIGNLDQEDVKPNLTNNDPYAWEPQRHPALILSSEKPFNAEPPPELLILNSVTPQELFYVRNHFPVPEVDPQTYELEITGVGVKTRAYSLDDLKKLPRHTINATIMCAGNRRSEMSRVKPVRGLTWRHGAVGNAEWTGVKLCDLLRSLGVTENSGALHIQFEGLDTDVTNTPYGASIPLASALDPKGDVLLAYEMNGEPLTRDHGFPVRVVVPGIVGARNVKWLSKIIISKEESDSHWQQRDYKGFNASVDWDTVDFSKSPAIQELPVISAVCVPRDGQTVKIDNDNTITVKGYAWSGGGRDIIRVDLTCDNGNTWHSANLMNKNAVPGQRVWNWTLWEAKIPIPNDAINEVNIWVKAVDSSYNTQPENFENIWNLRGVLNNAYHKVNVNVSK